MDRGWTSNRSLRAGLAFLACSAGSWAGVPDAAAIPCVSGFVRGPDGRPVADADLDFTVAATGQRIITPGDNTDATGFYAVCVLPNTYDVGFAPPAGTRLLGRMVPGLPLVDENGHELSITLQEGLVASGVVRDAAGTPVPGVDIDVDRVGGERLYTPGDNTAADGSYRVVVPTGLHRFRFEPPRGSRLRGAEVDSVEVASDAAIDVVLAEGLLLQGRIVDTAGEPAVDVDVELRENGTSAKVYLTNNATDALGDYLTAVPQGVFELRFTPPRAASLVAAVAPDFAMTGDATRDQVLERGHRLEVTVLGLGDLPLADADLDVKDAVTGAKIFTPHDRADAAGRTVAVLPGGTYDIIIDAPPGADYAGALVPGVNVTADTQLTVRLTGAPRVIVTGRVLDERGAPVAGAEFGAVTSLGGEQIRLADGRTTPDGSYALNLPPVPVDLSLVGPAGSRLVPRRLPDALALADTAWADLVLSDGMIVEVTVTGSAGRGVSGADLDVFDEPTGAEAFTPDDDTDGSGRVVLVLPAGAYRIAATPPARSGFSPGVAAGVVVDRDTAVRVVLEVDNRGGRSAVLLPSWPNPFRNESTISLQITAPADAAVSIHDVRGRLVRRLALPGLAEGRHAVIWDGNTGSGVPAPSGVYFIVLETALGRDSSRITLVR